jgi:hypothetical protein
MAAGNHRAKAADSMLSLRTCGLSPMNASYLSNDQASANPSLPCFVGNHHDGA